MTKGIFIRLFNIAWKVIFVSILLMLVTNGCSSDDDDDLVGNWIELSDYDGDARTGAVVFVINDKAYVGLGYDGVKRDSVKDFYAYSAANNEWSRIADFPGVGRNGAVAFGTSSKGYVGTGLDDYDNKLKDFYEYNPATNEWTPIADFGGSARFGAVAFAINDTGYVGTGYDGSALKDFWKYDPTSGLWTEISSLPDGKRREAVAFVIDDKGYVATGVDNGEYEDRFCVYNPETGKWSSLRDIADNSDDDYDDDYTNIVGNRKVAFSINGKGYIATGGQGTYGATAWEYDPTTDLWEEKTGLEATARIEAVGFAIGNMGFVTTGNNSSYYLDDLWGFEPDAEQVDLDKSLIVNP